MIPKVLHHIWIGPKKPPLKWMNSWREKHPDWEYHLWGNESINSFGFKNIELINILYNVKMYDGVADLMRYEILYKYGGVMPGADCQCLLPVDDLLNIKEGITVYSNEKYADIRTSPVIACIKEYSFLEKVIQYFIDNRDYVESQLAYNNPPVVTGDWVITSFIEKYSPSILILPSNALIGDYVYHNGHGYYSSNPLYNKRYAIQHWGTGRGVYE
jgi:mannosyltransferase OCH1-like enzyme